MLRTVSISATHSTNPRLLWRELSGVELKLLDELAFISRLHAARSPTKAHYAIPSRAYLAEKLGVHVDTITRHTTRLNALGVLSKTQRRRVRGRWQTCLYKIIHPAAWAMARLWQTLRKHSHGPAKVPALASSTRNQQLTESKDAAFSRLIRTWKARGGHA